MERDPNKRRIKPPTQNYLDFEDLGESSDDSDFRIEDHAEDSDDTINSKDSNSKEIIDKKCSVNAKILLGFLSFFERKKKV